MAKSNKPLFWGLFAAGGTLSAFVMPALVIVTLMAGYGLIPDALAYDRMHAFAGSWLGKLAFFALISLSLWHAAHRMRTALYGLGLRADRTVSLFGYSVAAAGTLLCIYFLSRI